MAACETSPQRPQPTQLSITVAIGSSRSTSGLGLMVRRASGKANTRMISRAGFRIDTEARCDYLLSRRQLFRIWGRRRRCRASWHSLSAMMTFRPPVVVVSASRRVFTIWATLYVTRVFIHCTPTPCRAALMWWPVRTRVEGCFVEGRYCCPVADE
ncbi:MAG: hypothetical protein Ct9H300mP13_6520 [Gammaproteobacteria bacterium]|nr:MAG: hypothetical protein Ct9H300mP13_6520 [Gammaproteobacteria bacterium]